MKVPIIEAGMSFGPYPEGHLFYIEKCETYKAMGEGVQIAEFLLLRPREGQPSSVWVVEAKSTSPRSGDRLEEYIREIRDKLTNALALGVSACLGRIPAAEVELPPQFRALDLRTSEVRLILIIRTAQADWLPP